MPEILIVDDDENIRRVLTRRFQKHGYDVFTAENAQRAIELVQIQQLSLVLLDYMMPDMDGIELFKQLKSVSDVLPPVIMITAHPSLHLAIEFLRLGGVDFIEKPIDFNVLEIKAQRAIKSATKSQDEVIKRRQTEELLRYAKEQAEEAQKAAEEARRAAESANRAKSEFLARMSHELRTPLNGILGYTQILKRDTQLTSQQRRAIDMIYRSGDHLLLVINDILDLSKVEAGKMVLQTTALHFPGMLNNIVDICRIRAQQQGLMLDYETITELPTGVCGDEKHLRQVLLNLLSNAIKFTEKGGVTFKVGRTPQQEVHLVQRYSEEDVESPPQQHAIVCIRFQIEDTGIGIPSEEINKIFSPFHQVNYSQTQTEGTGLGLAISQKLVRMMGSELYVKSTFGQGTTFWFDIAFQETTLPQKKKDLKKPQIIMGYRGKKRTILIADDKAINRMALKDMLGPLGFGIIEAENGHNVLVQAHASPPDLIVMDLIMPEMDGFETTQRLRQHPDLKDIPVVAISASAFEQTREKSILAGCDGFLAKPFRDDDLFKLLQTHMQLEWIVEEDGARQAAESQPDQFSIVPPSAEELVTLDKLTIRGDIVNLREHAAHLSTFDPKLEPFAEKILQFADEFQIVKIQQFIESYLSDHK